MHLVGVYWMVSRWNCFCKCRILNLRLLKICLFIIFCAVSFFLLVKSTTPFKCLLKKYSQLSVNVNFSCLLNYAVQFLGIIFKFSSQKRKRKKTSLSGRRLQEHWYYVNVAYKEHISLCQAYIQDMTRETSHPVKILDHQISHFESIWRLQF